MLIEELLNKKEDIYKIVEKNKGIQVKVFGSTVTGSATDQSNIDILVKFRPDATLFDLVEIKLECSTHMNRTSPLSEFYVGKRNEKCNEKLM